MESILLKSLASKKVTYLDRTRVTCQEREPMGRSWGARGAACMMSPKANRFRSQRSDLRGGGEWSLLTRGGNRTVI